ncbi:LuxR C-terminal-related transcriptional regulator [Alkanindiges sp. WGS2144]|uniref:LuxR C-terminal-related transcriptional regulator n=1 Tax=Alkanindiges sp. WGS2144 TaxID=3366808 RepID=UPI0037527746
MDMLTEQENHIIGMIYDASLNGQLWPQVLENIVDYTNSTTAIFTVLDQLNPNYDFIYTHNIARESLAAYQEEQVKVIDMKIHTPLWEKAGVGGVIRQNCLPYADMPGSDEYIFYKKCLEPTGVAYITAVLLDAGQYRWGVLGLHRSPSSSEYTQQESDTLKRLGKHLRRALQIHRQLCAIQQENRELYQLLDYLKTGVVILDDKGCIQHTNIKARQILERSSILWPDQYNRLKTIGALQNKLDILIKSALYKHTLVNHSETGGVLGLYEGMQEKSLMLTVVPLSNLASVHVEGQQQRVAIFLTESSGRHQLAEQFVKERYSLSKRELQMCELFLNGLNLEEIAAHCGISLQSARTYLKHIFSKTQCSSQVELMRLLAGLTVDFEHIA